jgi:DNA-binding response OmpR family regulator
MESKPRLVLGLSDNLIFTTRIESTAEKLGYRVHWVDFGDDNEYLFSGDRKEKSPDLILFDLDLFDQSPGSYFLRLKSDPATSEVPMICFGSHKDTETFTAAKVAGADQVLARSRFFSSLAEILKKYISED